MDAHPCALRPLPLPFARCVMGNCMSLQREHESAIRCFQRALQLDRTRPYPYSLVRSSRAYTLTGGHEWC